jgi:phosphosulfolactate phosphohydrolase-like enzyme
VYVSCLRNLSATVAHLAGHHDRIAIVAAGLAGESRFEDEMVAAWLARDLRAAGHAPEDRATALAIERWRRGDVSLIGLGKSAERLRARGLQAELAFIMSHVDDVRTVCRLSGSEISAALPVPAIGEEAAWTQASPLEERRAS